VLELPTSLQGLESARARRTRIGSVDCSIEPVRPQPWTPFQWDPMQDARSIKHKVAMLRQRLRAPRTSRARRGIAARGVLPDDGLERRIAASAASSNGLKLRAAKLRDPFWHELSKIHREVEAGENSSLPDPDFFVTVTTSTTNCCRGTLSIITFTNGFCWPNERSAS